MASWDNVVTQGPPAPASYAAPLVDFSNIGNLGNTYFQGQQQSRQLAMNQPILGPDGKPTTDVNTILQETLKRGGATAAQGLLPYLLMSQQSQQPWPGSEDTTQPQGQAQSTPVPPHGIPASPPTRPGGDQPGSIIDMVGAAGVPESEAGRVSAQILKNLKAAHYNIPDENTAITDPRVKDNIQNQLKTPGAQSQQPTRTVETAPPPAEDAGTNMQPYSQAQLDKVKRDSIESFRRAAGSPMQREALIAQGKEFQQQYRDMMKANEARSPSSLEFEKNKALQADAIKRSEAKYTGIEAASSQYENEGRPYIDLARSVLNEPRAYTGIGASRALDWNKVKALFGGDPAYAAMQEALTKVTAQQTLNTINLQKDQAIQPGSNASRIFTAQVDLARKTAAGIENTLTGNRFLVEVQARTGERFSQIAKMARDYMDKNGGVLDRGWDTQLSKWLNSDEGKLFTKAELANPVMIGAPQVPEGVASGGRQKVDQWATDMGMGEKDVMRTHDGRYVHPHIIVRPSAGSAVAAPQPQQM